MSAGAPIAVIGWTLDPAEREALLRRLPPTEPDVVAHHVTLASGTAAARPLPPEKTGKIVGVARDGSGVEALVVRIGGTTDRPGGGSYHITWSLDRARGRIARHSNDVIAACGFEPLLEPIGIRLIPARFTWPRDW